MIETLKEPPIDSEKQTISPSDISPSEKKSWFDLLPEILGIIVMAIFVGELIYLATQHRLWF